MSDSIKTSASEKKGIAMDTLHRLFELATLEGNLSELKGRHAKHRLSLYADDAALFLNPHKEEV